MNLRRLVRIADDVDGIVGSRRKEAAECRLCDMAGHLGIPLELIQEALNWQEVGRMILVAQAVHRSTLPKGINEVKESTSGDKASGGRRSLTCCACWPASRGKTQQRSWLR